MALFERATKPDEAQPEVPAIGTPEEPSEGLGPAHTQDFPAAVGLDGLLAGGTKAPPTGGTAAPPGAPPASPPLDPRLVNEYVKQLDTTISVLTGLEPEEPELMDGIATGMYPLFNHYARGTNSVAIMWLVAGTNLLAYMGIKYKQIQERAADYEPGGGEAQTVDRRPEDDEES